MWLIDPQPARAVKVAESVGTGGGGGPVTGPTCTPALPDLSNVAVTDVAPFTETLQVVLVPAEAQAPPQPPKIDIAPAVGVAVKVTVRPVAYPRAQVAPQLMPMPVTVPL